MVRILKSILIVLLLISLAANTYGQGYMGTVSTGTGIIPALTVGKSSISSSGVGSILIAIKPHGKLVS